MKQSNYWSDEEIQILQENYTKVTKQQLLTFLPKRKWNNIVDRARMLKIPYNGEYRQKITDLSYLLTETNLKYYWLGFLLADGHFCSNAILVSLSIKDKNHLDKLGFLTKGVVKEKTVKSNMGKGIFDQACLYLGDRNIITQIKDRFKIVSNKTHNPPDFNSIHNDDHILSLFIGYLDGDGCIRTYKEGTAGFQFYVHSSWLSILQWFHKHLERIFGYALTSPKLSKRPNTAFWSSSDMRLMKGLKQFILNNKIDYLERKWDRVNLNFFGFREEKEWRKTKIIEFLREGLTYSQIAEKLEVSKVYIGNLVGEIRKQNNIPRNKHNAFKLWYML